MNLTGENRSTRGKSCLSATLSITNPTWTNLGSNQLKMLFSSVNICFALLVASTLWRREVCHVEMMLNEVDHLAESILHVFRLSRRQNCMNSSRADTDHFP
jgi:hypothetical protein